MRVLHLTPQYFRVGKMGGGERYVREIAVAQDLIENTDTIVVEVNAYSSARLARRDGFDVSAEQGVMSLRELIRTARQASVLHVHQMNSTAFEFAIAMRAVYGKPVVMTDHGGGFVCVSRVMGARRLNHVDAMALVSETSVMDLGLVNDKRATVIWGGGDHVSLPSNAANLAPSRHFDFGYVGRILPHKGLHVAIESLPPEATLVVAGEFRDPSYKEYVTSLACDRRVEFVGPIADAELAHFYLSIGALVVPSTLEFRGVKFARPELLGLVALEALCLGTPVIGSDVGGLGELLRRLDQHWVRPGSVAELSSAMLRFLSEGAAVSERTDLTWRGVADRCAPIYRRAIGCSS